MLQADEIPLRRRRRDRAVAPGACDSTAQERRVQQGFPRTTRAAEASRAGFSGCNSIRATAASPAGCGILDAADGQQIQALAGAWRGIDARQRERNQSTLAE